jgi:hypothetical protein
MVVPYRRDMSPSMDVIEIAPAGRTRRRPAMVPAAGVVVAAVLGAFLVTVLTDEDEGLRAQASLGAPRQSLGQVFAPLDVRNSGTGEIRVEQVRSPDGSPELTVSLETTDTTVPAGDIRELLVSVTRDCSDGSSPPADEVRLELVVRGDGDSIVEPVVLAEPVAGLLTSSLLCQQ